MNRREVIKTSLAVGSATLAGCLGPESQDSEPAPEDVSTSQEGDLTTRDDGTRTDYDIEIVAEGFAYPWGLSFLPDDTNLLITERPGRLRMLNLSEGSTATVSGVPEVYSSGQGGLLDVTVGPDPNESWVYLTYSATNRNGESTTHVARGRIDTAAPKLMDVENVHVAEPFVSSNAHYGSRIVFGPEDRLYVTVGDRQFKDFGPDHVAQVLTNELGATLRLEADGTVPEDNPFVDEPDGRDTIFSYGHRNPQGLAVHPETGDVWQSEHGERDGDEINIIEPGHNYGWPVASESCHYGSDDLVGKRHQERPHITEPVYFWPCGSGGFPPSGMTFYTGTAFPDWHGDLFLGTLAGERLGRFSVTGRTVKEKEPILREQNWRIRALTVSPATGELFVAVDAGNAPIIKITPAT